MNPELQKRYDKVLQPYEEMANKRKMLINQLKDMLLEEKTFSKPEIGEKIIKDIDKKHLETIIKLVLGIEYFPNDELFKKSEPKTKVKKVKKEPFRY